MSGPAFDSVRKALVFAFNADQAYLPSPLMNRMMADAGRPSGKDRTLDLDTKRAKLGETFRGLDKSAQAGFILHHVGRLDLAHKSALEARLTRRKDPCSCGAPCCKGWRHNPRFRQAVEALCLILKDEAELVRVKGKKGLSTPPDLRWAIVEAWFVLGTDISVTKLAEAANLSTVTAAKHKNLIIDYLRRTEDEAWAQIAEILDSAGMVGAFD